MASKSISKPKLSGALQGQAPRFRKRFNPYTTQKSPTIKSDHLLGYDNVTNKNNGSHFPVFPGVSRERKMISTLQASSDEAEAPTLLDTRNDIYVNNPIERVNVERFLRQFLEDRYSFKDRRPGNRFCAFFADLLKQVTTISRNERATLFSAWWKEELANMELLLYEAIHCYTEKFELFFDIAYNTEFFIVHLLTKKESVFFFEAMVNTARQRHSQRQHGTLLSCFGQVLRSGQHRISEAYEQYMKALDVLLPFGESRDLAWLHYHIACVWMDKGMYKRAERYFQLAKSMLQREGVRLSKYGEEVQNHSSYKQARIWTKRTLSYVFTTLGVLYNNIGDFEKSIKCHEDSLDIRRELFGLHPYIGQGFNNLCIVYDNIEDHKKALEYARKGLNVKEMFVTRESNTVIVSMLNLANMSCKYANNSSHALSLLDRALDTRKTLGFKHNLTGTIYVYRGQILLHLEQYDQAAVSFSNAVDIFRQIECQPRSLAEATHYWGVAEKNCGNLEEAEKHLYESLKIIEKVAKENNSFGEENQIKDTLMEIRSVRARMQSVTDAIQK